ncbi:hypothetical protein [Streptomyces smyrnaeus]|uniref:hypothetical protein n=1 Tax=Streptomyces smyrnaeus TaxID=1387713 RepID=UPI003675970D
MAARRLRIVDGGDDHRAEAGATRKDVTVAEGKATFREQNPATGQEDRAQVLGLIVEPGMADETARRLADDLPAALEEADGSHSRSDGGWRVEVITEFLPLDAEGCLRLLDIGRDQRRAHGWDVVVVLTELPRRAGKLPILADCAPEHGVGLVSLPALGASRLRHRMRAVLVHLVTGCLSGEQVAGRHTTGETMRAALPSGRYRLIDEREAGREREEQQDQRAVDANVRLDGVGLHYALPGWRGKGRLLAGMVRANRPWRLVPSLSPALAAAVAGAAFGIFYSSIWQLADVSSTLRLAGVNALAIGAMIAWLILANGLWERSPDRRLRLLSALYNAATLVTITCGVVYMFLLLLTATFLAALVVVPFNYLSSVLHHPAGASDLVTVAWLAACLGTLAGALGSGLSDENAVREAAYSKRERQRQHRRAAQEARAQQESSSTEPAAGSA